MDRKLDTRRKIVSAEEAARRAAAGATVVSGYFDPMTAEHAERLAQLKKDGLPLLVLIATPPDPILPDRARAELAAALQVVDYVALADPRLTPHVSLEQEDLGRQQRLIEHVRTRQHAAADSSNTPRQAAL